MAQVLIVDDIEGVHEMLDLVFEDTGIDLLHALSGEEAVKVFCNNTIDLVLTDIEMPGMSGLELFSELKRMDERVVVVMMTAAESRDFVLKALRLGAYDYIEKPYDEDELIATVQRGVQERQQRLQVATADGANPELVDEMQRLKAELDSYEDTKAQNEQLAAELEMVRNELTQRKQQDKELKNKLTELELKEGAMKTMENVMRERMDALKSAEKEQGGGGLSAEAQAELQRLKEELELKENELQTMETNIQERELFLQESEESLFEKGQRLQEIETELEQMREDLQKQGGGSGGGGGEGLSPEELSELENMRAQIKEKEEELVAREKSLAKTEKLIKAREQFLAQSETILFGDKEDE
ncbi:response regulator [Cerasicoccus fimbriatus]|uniref:response regulator n=1 Tax=Cerasicoccus fimbriatus TaxID=3014554 RepID=UPI0022B4E8C7|nr:response regulator [Cerasicoccus sp. TK19100]